MYKKGNIFKLTMNAESFWVRVVQVTRHNLYVFVDNVVLNQSFSYGHILKVALTDLIQIPPYSNRFNLLC